MLSTAVANTNVQCAANEFLSFQPPQGMTCGQYMEGYIQAAGGYLTDPNSTDSCSFCTISDTNVYLASANAYYSDRWRNLGIFWAYIVFNIFAALVVYWLARVPKKSLFGKKKKE